MAKVTSKLQLTIPKAIADAHGIVPGTELEFESAQDVIRLRLKEAAKPVPDLEQRLRAFDEATHRQAERDRRFELEQGGASEAPERGWSRESLYDRGLAR